MSLLDCQGCGAIIPCGDIPDSALYSLEDQSLPFVFDCPDGFNCNSLQGGLTIYLQCCSTVLTVTFPNGASTTQILSILNDYSSQCIRLQSACPGGGIPTGPPTIDNPVHYFFSRPQTCSIKCPDGNVFTYTVRAGIAGAFTQSAADALAHAIACQQASAKRFCLGSITTACCLGTAFTTTVTAFGNPVVPITWEIVSGALPDGLTLGGFSPSLDVTAGNSETIEGTPTVAGSFTFTLKATGEDGTFMQKVYTMCVSGITPTSLPSGTADSPYSQTLSFTGCASGTATWAVTSGALPTGLTLNPATGVISGTPTVAATYTFTITGTFT